MMYTCVCKYEWMCACIHAYILSVSVNNETFKMPSNCRISTFLYCLKFNENNGTLTTHVKILVGLRWASSVSFCRNNSIDHRFRNRRLSPRAKTIKKNTCSTQNKSAKQYEVTSFLSTYCELSTETCSKNVYSLGP